MIISKEQFRKQCLKKLQKDIPNRYYLNKKVQQNLLKLLKKRQFKTVLFYIPLKFEANVIPVLQHFRKKSQILTPFMEDKSFKMVSYRLPLKRKKFGIYEAGNSYKKFKNIDIAIVPIVGYDKNFKRIGFGKGMYDRFFEKLNKKPWTVFVQLKKCYIDKPICDDYDVYGDIVVTSEGWLEKRR